MKSNLYFKHDLYSVENDDCLRLVCSEYPVWGEAVFSRAITILYRKGGEPYNLKLLIHDIAHDLYTDNRDKIADILALCIEVDLFKLTDDGKCVFSSRVSDECGKQKNYSESQKKKAEKRWESTFKVSESDATALPRYNNSNATAIPRQCHGNANKQEQEQEQDIYIVSNKLDTRQNSHFDTPISAENEADSDLFGKVEVKVEKTPTKEIVDYWNKSCEKSGLPKVIKVSEKRAKAIKTIWNEFKEDTYKAIDMVAESKFLQGQNERNWSCFFDWVIDKGHMLKILEGTYNKNGNNSNNKFSPPDITNQYANLKFKKVTEL